MILVVCSCFDRHDGKCRWQCPKFVFIQLKKLFFLSFSLSFFSRWLMGPVSEICRDHLKTSQFARPDDKWSSQSEDSYRFAVFGVLLLVIGFRNVSNRQRIPLERVVSPKLFPILSFSLESIRSNWLNVSIEPRDWDHSASMSIELPWRMISFVQGRFFSLSRSSTSNNPREFVLLGQSLYTLPPLLRVVRSTLLTFLHN